MIELFLFTDPNLSAEVEQLQRKLADFAQQYPYHVTVIDISGNAFLQQAYEKQLPSLEIGAFTLGRNASLDELEFALSETRGLSGQLAENKVELRVDNKQIRLTAWDRVALWFPQYYLQVIIGLLILIVGLAFLAPVLMETGQVATAQSLYALYSPFCHQLAFRSLFLFGAQPFYPRELAGVSGLLTYGQATGLSETDFAAASAFVGNPQLGYKVALCQRDIAIQSALLLFTLVYAFSHQKIKSVPILLWALVGFLPIVLDGGTQLLSQLGWPALAWLAPRESAPWQRLLTGGLFGFFSAWFVLPIMQESLYARRLNLEKKSVIARQTQAFKAEG